MTDNLRNNKNKSKNKNENTCVEIKKLDDVKKNRKV